MIIFPRHQIWCLSYNLVTPIEAHSCITKHHIFNQKAQQESSVLQDCGHIKITYMSHNKFFISVELVPNTPCCARCFFTKKCMAPQVRRLGVRAKTSCLSKIMHPSEYIRNKFPNPVAGHRLEGCIVVWQEVKCVTKRDQLCVVVWHDDFKADDEHIELHAVKQYF